MMKFFSTLFGAMLCITALTGFAFPTFMNMALNPMHNIFLLTMGVLSLFFGLKSTESKARNMCRVLGVTFSILGAATLFAPSGIAFPDTLNLQSSHVLKLIPGHLEYTTSDGVRDLLMGLLALVAGFLPISQKESYVHGKDGRQTQKRKEMAGTR